jgi:hypothetical protein
VIAALEDIRSLGSQVVVVEWGYNMCGRGRRHNSCNSLYCFRGRLGRCKVEGSYLDGFGVFLFLSSRGIMR